MELFLIIVMLELEQDPVMRIPTVLPAVDLQDLPETETRETGKWHVFVVEQGKYFRDNNVADAR